MSYAAGTVVSRDRTVSEIERDLTRFGATGFMYGWQGAQAAIAFQVRGYHVRLVLPLPDPKEERAVLEEGKRIARQARTKLPRSPAEAFEQITRQHWRALALIIKAKLVAIDEGVRSFEQEFGLDIVLPDGGTVGPWLTPQLEESYRSGHMPPMLPGIGET